MTTSWCSDTRTSGTTHTCGATGPAEQAADHEDSAQQHPRGPDRHRVGEDTERHDREQQDRAQYAAAGEDAVDDVVGGLRRRLDGAVADRDDRLLDRVRRLAGPLAHRLSSCSAGPDPTGSATVLIARWGQAAEITRRAPAVPGPGSAPHGQEHWAAVVGRDDEPDRAPIGVDAEHPRGPTL